MKCQTPTPYMNCKGNDYIITVLYCIISYHIIIYYIIFGRETLLSLLPLASCSIISSDASGSFKTCHWALWRRSGIVEPVCLSCRRFLQGCKLEYPWELLGEFMGPCPAVPGIQEWNVYCCVASLVCPLIAGECKKWLQSRKEWSSNPLISPRVRKFPLHIHII